MFEKIGVTTTKKPILTSISFDSEESQVQKILKFELGDPLQDKEANYISSQPLYFLLANS